MSVKVRFRKDRKRWQVDYVIDGKRKKPLFLEKPEADKHARKIRLGLAPEDQESITIDEAGKKYFKLISPKKCPKSKSNDQLYLNLHHYFMTEDLGIERMGTVRLEDLQAFRDWLPKLKEQPWPVADGSTKHRPMAWSNSTVNRCVRVIKAFYRQHIKWGDLKADPCTYLEFLGTTPKERAVMNHEQYMATFEKLELFMRRPLTLMYLAGVPASCVARLEWADVNFTTREFTVWRLKGRRAEVKRIKLGMTDQVFALLVGIRNQWPEVHGAVFRDHNGIPLLADRITKTCNEAARTAGIKGVTMYGLRHALATDMTEANISAELVRQAMGHSSISTTLNYTKKVQLKAVSGAVETVRGDKVGTNPEFDLRTKSKEKLS